MYCPKCGTQNNDESLKCGQCGEILKTGAVSSGNDTIATLIPYKNSKALIAYYLGVFSIIPCVGSPLGIAASVLGLQGLKYAKEHPEAKGKAHAWVGVILGGLFGLIYTVFIIITAVEMMMRK
jgi:hypothetical protein